MVETKNRTKVTPSVISFVFTDCNAHFSKLPMLWVKLFSIFSKPKIIFPKKEFSSICSSFPTLENSQGTMVKDTNRESIVEIITVTQNCTKISATSPVAIAIGRNTTTITKVIAVTVNPISDAPS